MSRVICVVGPTASGKTELAIRLANELHGEIVSCDSMQIYRRMDIGTAKPTPEEQARAVHHMIDVAEPDEDYSVGRYVEQADACVQQLLSEGKTVIVVGGTGLYCDALMQGRSFAPLPETGVRQELCRRCESEGSEALLKELAAVDPETAARLHPADKKRILRALEVFLETGVPISVHNAETQKLPPKYDPIRLAVGFEDRAELYERIDLRVEKMRRAGLDGEVRRLLAQGVAETATSMQAIGYKELLACEKGELSRDEAYALIAQRSRNYAKRQLTWFRRNDKNIWLMRGKNTSDDALFEAARQNISFFLQSP